MEGQTHCVTSRPTLPSYPDYNGSSFNVMIGWENRRIHTEPLQVIAKDDPVIYAIYKRENDLLDAPGWKQFKSTGEREKYFCVQ